MSNLNFQAPPLSDCRSVHPHNPYKLEAPGFSVHTYSSTSVTFLVDSEQTFTVSVQSRDNEETLSSEIKETLTAPLLRKRTLL